MRKGFLGSIAALAAGAGTAWAQPPLEPAPPAGVPVVAPAQALTGPSGSPKFGGLPFNAIPGNSGYAPAPTIMPPGNYGPPEDPLGLGPVGGFGPPPGPMYPMPGPPGAQSWQPAAPGSGGPGGDDLGYGAAPRWWVDGEYLLWFTRGQELRAPLLTSSAPSDGGVVGAASTAVLVGNRALDYGGISGMRLTAGFFGDADRRIGFQIQGFFTEHKPNNQKFGDLNNTAGTPTLARPFIDTLTGLPGAVVLSGPNFGAAVVKVRTDTQTIGVEPVGLWNIYRAEPGCRKIWSIDFLAGYKFLQVRENLIVSSFTQMDDQIALPVFAAGPFGQVGQVTSIIPAQAPLGGVIVGGPAVVQLRDQFRATNRFNGAVIGLKSEGRYGLFTTSFTAKIAGGNLYERVEILGNTTFIDTLSRSGTPTPFGFPSGIGGNGGAVGGVLANASNIGTYSRDKLTYIPEAGATFGIALTRGLTGYIGVNFIYFPEIIRVGSAVNPAANSAAVPFSPNFGQPGAPRAAGFRFIEEDLWIGGVSGGLMLRY